MSKYHLAELNVAELKAPLDSPMLKDFVDNLDRINALADASPGFVWRLQGEGNDATGLRPMGEKIIVNFSVWTDVENLRNYVYKTVHVEILKRKREWFHRMTMPHVLWWVPAGYIPTVAEAVAKLELLRTKGPSADAFHFGEIYSAPDAHDANAPTTFPDACPA
ncbi:MAG TPA: DUF3291 domain-containing protein [Steroidobacteraceae bacterium]|nr:DUF3291 domain-containing protein [Steroidobacteraceae bacterium]